MPTTILRADIFQVRSANRFLVRLLLLAAPLGIFNGSQLTFAQEKQSGAATVATEPNELPENFRSVDELLQRALAKPIFCGGEPSDADLRGLAAKGIRTIVSVDGVKPKVELARQLGMRYVHIPMGYDGVAKAEGLQLAHVARDCDGPIYLHCHHGKHRAPAATAFMLLATEQIDAQASSQILTEAGTSRQYAGLWRDVLAAKLIPISQDTPELVAVADVALFASQMAMMDRRADELQTALTKTLLLINETASQTDTTANQRHLRTTSELSLLLLETFQESLRVQDEVRDLSAQQKVDFQDRMRSGLDRVRAIYDRINEMAGRDFEKAFTASSVAQLQRDFSALKADCKSCHTAYRNGASQNEAR